MSEQKKADGSPRECRPDLLNDPLNEENLSIRLERLRQGLMEEQQKEKPDKTVVAELTFEIDRLEDIEKELGFSQALTPEQQRTLQLEEEYKELALENARLEFKRRQKDTELSNLKEQLTTLISQKSPEQRTKFLAQCAESHFERMPKGPGSLILIKQLNDMRRDAIVHLDREAAVYGDNYKKRYKKYLESWEYDEIFGQLINLLVEIELNREELKEYA